MTLGLVLPLRAKVWAVAIPGRIGHDDDDDDDGGGGKYPACLSRNSSAGCKLPNLPQRDTVRE